MSPSRTMVPFCSRTTRLLEFLHRAQVGVGGQVDLDEGPLAPAQGGQEVVGGQGLAHLGRADVEGGHPIGLEPDAHGKGARAEDVGPLHPLDGGQAGLDDAHQVVGDLVLLQHVGGEAQIGRGKLAVGRLDVDHRHLGLGRQVAAHLVDLGADLGQRLGGVVVELEADLDGGEAQGALGLHVLDAVGGGDGPLQRRGDETAHQFGAGAHVDGGDGDRGVLAARVLADVEGADRLKPGDDDDQVDHQGQHGTADEEIGDFHERQLFSGVGACLEGGGKSVVHGHGLAVAQFEDPGAHDLLSLTEPAGYGDEVAALLSEANELLTQRPGPCRSLSSSMTKTESP